VLDDAIRRLLAASSLELETAIDAVLASALRLVDADGVSLSVLRERGTTWRRYSFLPDVPWPKRSSPSRAADLLDMRQLRAGRVAALSRIEELPSTADSDLRMLRRDGVRSALLVPLGHDDAVLGEIRFLTVARHRSWTQGDADLARRLGALLASALLRLDAEQAREADLRSRENASEVAACFLDLSPDRLGNAVERALGLIARFAGATQASAWRVKEGGRSLQLVAAAGHRHPTGGLGSRTSLPCGRLSGCLAADEPLLLSGLVELPAQARVERELLERLQVRALVGLSLHAGGKWIGWMGIGRRLAGAWPEAMVRHLQMLGAIVGGAFIRAGEAERLARRESDLKRLTLELFRVQDVERRRIARELHDGTAQHVYAASLEMARLARWTSDPRETSTLQEAEGLCLQALKEMRTLSYLLHPPLLDDRGLVPALRWFASGVAARTGLHIIVSAHDSVQVPRHAEVALFRVVQEALTNVHRHARAREVLIELRLRRGNVVVSVADDGQGFRRAPPGTASGVGILGMRERLRQLGGRLRIVRRARGTLVLAAFPLVSSAPRRGRASSPRPRAWGSP
jgi:two-component system NarL family sensor kinase